MLTTVAAGRVFDHSFSYGMYALSGQGFWTPQDFALNGDTLYVVNRGAEDLGQRITICTLDHQYITQFGGPGSGDGQFVWPRSIALDRAGNIYVSDDYLHRISVFDKDGQFLSKWGNSGGGNGQLNAPAGIAFDSDDNLYIVDSLNHRVQKFTKDGTPLATFGKQGSGDGELDMPWGICIDSTNNVFVADWRNNRVQKFDANGNLLVKFEGTLSGVGGLSNPTDVAVDSEGDVYVTDWGNHRVQVYAPDGTFITTLLGDAQQPSPWAQTLIEANPDNMKARRRTNLEPEWRFRRPTAIKVDAQDRIFILESGNHRFQIYNKEKEYEEHALTL